MTPIEQAARQAPEALNEVTGWQWAGPMRVMDEVGDAIAALREALSGVQALSAAPVTPSPWTRALEIRMAQGWRLKGDRIPVLYTDAINGEGVGRDDLWLCTTAALAASPTPPAEQQAEESLTKLLAECRCAFPVPEHGSPLEVQWAAAMARPEEVPEYVRLCVAAMQAAPKAAPVVWLSSKQLRGVTALHGQYLPFRCQPEGRFDTPVYLVEAAPKAAPASNESAYQRGYMDGMAKGRRDAEAAPQQEAQEPYAYAVYFPDQPKVELVHELDALIDDLTNRPNVVTKLYTAPQPAPAPLSDDAKRLAWMADGWTPGHEKLYAQHVLETGGVGDVDDLRTFIDKQIAAQRGK